MMLRSRLKQTLNDMLFKNIMGVAGVWGNGSLGKPLAM